MMESLEVDYFVGRRYAVGVACCQGPRLSMQDAYAAVLDNKLDEECDFVAVYDGHGKGGEDVAYYAAVNLCDKVLQDLVAVRWNNRDKVLLARVIQNAFIELDNDLRVMNKVKGGATACAIWIRRNVLYLANVGDTRAILSVGGKAHVLSKDHFPTSSCEAKRIYNAGGYVERGRVLGALAVSRAFGNFKFKNRCGLDEKSQMVTACPDVRIVDLTQDLNGNSMDYVVLLSDGVCDVLSDQDIVDQIQTMMNSQTKDNLRLDLIAKSIVYRCLKPLKNFESYKTKKLHHHNSSSVSYPTKDNLTLMIAFPLRCIK